MKNFLKFIRIAAIILIFIPSLIAQQTPIDSLVIYDSVLKSNRPGKSDFEVGVDSQFGEHDWVEDLGGNMEMRYRGKQSWGALFITIGVPLGDQDKLKRETDDYSNFTHYSVDLKGKRGGELIELALKDKMDLGNGRETKIPITVTDKWETYQIRLADYKSADLSDLHVINIFLFRGPVPRTVSFRNAKFLKYKGMVNKD